MGCVFVGGIVKRVKFLRKKFKKRWDEYVVWKGQFMSYELEEERVLSVARDIDSSSRFYYDLNTLRLYFENPKDALTFRLML